MLGELVPCGGGTPIPLLKPKLLVGRRSTCDIALPFPTVSSQHCELEFRDGHWFVRDLGSHNGTRVDGVHVQSKCLLPNCVLWIAKQRYAVVYTLPKDEGGREKDEGRRMKDEQPASAAAAVPHSSFILHPSSLGELVPCGGGEPLPLVKQRLTIGRREDCDITLPFGTVSSRHCELEFKDGYWYVRDLGSRNGIRVDGVPCQSNVLLPESVLWVAGHRYSVMYTPAEDAPPPDILSQSLLEKAGLVSRHAATEPHWPKEDPNDQPRKRWSLDREEE